MPFSRGAQQDKAVIRGWGDGPRVGYPGTDNAETQRSTPRCLSAERPRMLVIFNSCLRLEAAHLDVDQAVKDFRRSRGYLPGWRTWGFTNTAGEKRRNRPPNSPPRS